MRPFLPDRYISTPTPRKTTGAAITGTNFAPVASMTTTEITMTAVRASIRSPNTLLIVAFSSVMQRTPS
ncbi:hypothetical protein DER30_2257 [Streptomyces sp. HB202]|nr:hypothetical protein DER30_2257 [Streptomyces sp. HB202]